MHVAIIGCGQLSRMLALAGIPLGITFSFVADPGEDTRCVDGLGTIAERQSDQSIDALFTALGRPDVVSVEKEQVELALLEAFEPLCRVHPNPRAVSACQHRHREKQLLDKLGIASSPYTYAQSAADSADRLSLPIVVKSCTEGYDGKNQWVLKTDQDVIAFDERDVPSEHIMEKWIPFDREVSQVSVRASNGDVVHYPLAENTHDSGILCQSIAPAPDVNPALATRAQAMMAAIMESLDYVGTMAMECFLAGDELLVNELAPRVHNSGHWTQAGAITCQFQNHMRAITDLPLGSTQVHGVTGMVNLLGTKAAPGKLLGPNASLHWYNKVVRPGRKLGHVNILAENHNLVREGMTALQQALISNGFQ